MASLTDLKLDGLNLLSRGKVRDVYATSDPSALLFVASDRISAYDVILNNVRYPDASRDEIFILHSPNPVLGGSPLPQGIPGKGQLLTQLSLFWFQKLKEITPNHLITTDVDQMPAELHPYKKVLEGRSMLVKRAKVIPLEAIVRGYLSGSAWSEYKKTGTIHGIKLEPGLVESQKLPIPMFTPSTKAEQGEHDQNLHPDEAARLVGEDVYQRISEIALQLYTTAAEFALTKGVIIADTKFEFGLIPSSNHESPFKIDGKPAEIILVDEVLTPDSSRFWPAEEYAPGRPQASFDKQYLRDWLVKAGFVKGLEKGPDGNGWSIDNEVVDGTRMRYEEALERLTLEAETPTPLMSP